MHYLTNTEAQLRVIFDAGAATGNVAVSVKDADGVLVASGNATQDGTNHALYTFKVPPQTTVKSLTTTWTGTWDAVQQKILTYDEIVATQLFTLAELRAFDDSVLSDSSKWPDALLQEQRDRVTDDLEEICNVSFIRRYAKDVLDGNWRRFVYLMKRRPQTLLAISLNEGGSTDVFTSDELAEIQLYDSGKMYRPTPWPWFPMVPRNVTVEYEYGYPVPPAQIKYAALVLSRYELVTRDIGDRVLAVNTELGQVRLSVPGVNYPTGIPIVDAALARYDESSTIEAF